jgi:hypothetical protein
MDNLQKSQTLFCEKKLLNFIFLVNSISFTKHSLHCLLIFFVIRHAIVPLRV